MSGWVTRYYRFRQSRDSDWNKAIDSIPDTLGLHIEIDFGRSWIVDLPPVAAVHAYLAHSDDGVESLGDGRFIMTENVREAVQELLTTTGVKGRWWSLRRAHFASNAAQREFESLL